MTSIRDVFDLPSREEITAQEFVIKLDGDYPPEVEQKLVKDYVFTPTVTKELPLILDKMRHVQERRADMGRFIHGSFGSGKSHFMSLLSMMLRDRAKVWSKDADAIRAAEPHRAWIRDAKLLVVSVHMLSADDERFDRMLYDAANVALRRDGKQAFEFLHVDGVLDEMRREAEVYKDAFWGQLEDAGIVGSQADFDELARGSLQEREDLVRPYLEFKGRDTASAGVDPNWGKGLDALAEHVKAQGFGGLVFMVDEMLLWLGEKDRPGFTKAINDLNTIVDHPGGARAVPVYVFLARQRRLREFFPDMVDDEAMEAHLDHHSKRFEQTTLQDVELRHICAQRVLRKKDEAAVQKVVDGLMDAHKKALPELIGAVEDGAEYLRDVYPFHPALIEMLIDVSSLMQRERTALRLLYELLVIHYPDLPLGQFLPVGSAFEAVFPEGETPQGRRKLDDLQSVHRVYYERFRPAMQQMLQVGTEVLGFDFGDESYRVLDQLVKTALLAELSPRLKGGTGISVERLVRLNDADMVGHSDRGKLANARRALIELARKCPNNLQVVGDAKDARVLVVLHGANLEEYLQRARSKVGSHHVRFRVFAGILRKALGLEGAKGWGASDVKGTIDVKWKGTTRRGSVWIQNVRELANADFQPDKGEQFRILVDYPWDDAGKTVEADRERARNARKKQGNSAAVCWLPRHMHSHELDALTDYAAADYLCSPEAEELFTNLGAHDTQQLRQQADSRRSMMQRTVVDSLSRLYGDHGELLPLMDGLKLEVRGHELDQSLRRVGQAVLDRQYPEHPVFGIAPKAGALRSLGDWLVQTAELPEQSRGFEDVDVKPLQELGAPLELLRLGQTKGRLSTDTRYIKAVQERLAGERVKWDPIDELLAAEPYGFEVAVRSLFLVFVARLHGFRVTEADGTAITPEVGTKLRPGLVLERARVVDVAAWARARDLGPALFDGLTVPDAHRTISAQDRYVEALRRAGRATREDLQDLHRAIVGYIGEGKQAPRLATLKDALKRLAPLATSDDSHATLVAWLAQWPDDATDALRVAVRKAKDARDAVDAVQKHSLAQVRSVPAQHPMRGQADAIEADLESVLTADGAALTVEAVESWNGRAADFVRGLIAQPPPPPPPDSPTPPPERPTPPPSPPTADPTDVVYSQTVDVGDGDALTDFWVSAREKLKATGKGRVNVRILIEDD